MTRTGRKLRRLIFGNHIVRDRFSLYRRLGLRLLLNYVNHIDRKLIVYEPYERDELAHFREALNRERIDVFLDIGANIGIYSLLAARAPRVGEILSFEPDPPNYCQLNANVLLNRYTGKIAVYRYGLSDINGEIGFLQERGGSTGKSRVEDTSPSSTKMERYQRTTVRVRRFDDHFHYLNRQAFVKIDVEGHELRVLEGMRTFLGTNRCMVQVELFEENYDPFFRSISGLGYKKTLEFGDNRIFVNG